MNLVSFIRIAILAMAAWPLAAQNAAAGHSDDPVFREIAEMVESLAEITGLEPLRPVPYERLNKDQLREYLEQRMKEEVDPKEIALEEKILKKFGLIPREMDLKSSTLELLTEQAAAFYDYRRKKLYLVEEHGDAMMRIALVHELAHALADQHFDLGTFLDGVKEEDDASMARMAVMEGQASWLMSEYVARQAGQSILGSDAALSVMARASESEASTYPVFRDSPLYLRVTLLFPYTKGLVFQHRVLENLGQEGFRRIFTAPPVSTRQILEPGEYLSGVKPEAVKIPPIRARGYKETASGDLGQLDSGILFALAISRREGESLAANWRGGRFAFLENRKGSSVLVTATKWLDEESAGRVFRLWPQMLQSKWKTGRVTVETETRIAGQGDDGHFCVDLAGTTVVTKEGLPSPCR